MAGFAIFKGKDIDNKWHTFAQQNMDMSCGPTSVKIAKELVHNKSVGEEVIRGSVGLQYSGASNSGVSLVQAARASNDRWRDDGSIEHMIFPAVKKEPLPLPNAKFVKGIAPLKQASRSHPAILGFNWDGGGGHFVVCVGPTTSNPKLFVILDPDGGIQYLNSDDANGDELVYKPTYGSVGKIDGVGYIVT